MYSLTIVQNAIQSDVLRVRAMCILFEIFFLQIDNKKQQRQWMKEKNALRKYRRQCNIKEHSHSHFIIIFCSCILAHSSLTIRSMEKGGSYHEHVAYRYVCCAICVRLLVCVCCGFYKEPNECHSKLWKIISFVFWCAQQMREKKSTNCAHTHTQGGDQKTLKRSSLLLLLLSSALPSSSSGGLCAFENQMHSPEITHTQTHAQSFTCTFCPKRKMCESAVLHCNINIAQVKAADDDIYKVSSNATFSTWTEHDWLLIKN